jgi:hypothetical protein
MAIHILNMFQEVISSAELYLQAFLNYYASALSDHHQTLMRALLNK